MPGEVDWYVVTRTLDKTILKQLYQHVPPERVIFDAEGEIGRVFSVERVPSTAFLEDGIRVLYTVLLRRAGFAVIGRLGSTRTLTARVPHSLAYLNHKRDIITIDIGGQESAAIPFRGFARQGMSSGTSST